MENYLEKIKGIYAKIGIEAKYYSYNGNEFKDKLVTTYIENNGGMGHASNSVREKQKKTILEKYGCEYSLQNDQEESKLVQSLHLLLSVVELVYSHFYIHPN